MSLDPDRSDLAAEYVLGTLDAAERDATRELIAADPAFATEVEFWERRLDELQAMVDAVAPPPEVWDAIAARLGSVAAAAVPALHAAQEAASPAAEPAVVSGAAAEQPAADLPRPEPPGEEPPRGEAAAVAEAAIAAVAEALAQEPTESPPLAPTGPMDGDRPTETAGVGALVPIPERDPVRDRELDRLRRSRRRWRTLAVGIVATAAALVGLVVLTVVAPDELPDPLRRSLRIVEPMFRRIEPVRPIEPPMAPARLVAVLQNDGAAPAFLLSVDLARRSLTVRRVAAETQAGKSFELWLVSERFQAPHSLGLVGVDEFTHVPALAGYEPDVVGSAVYAVSLEPEGGSSTGAPTGPVLFSGKLLETGPPAAARSP